MLQVYTSIRITWQISGISMRIISMKIVCVLIQAHKND